MLKNFTCSPFPIPNLFGPIGRGDDMQTFYEKWRAKNIRGTTTVVVGRKDGSGGCFSLHHQPRSGPGAVYKVYYYDRAPDEVFAGITDDHHFDGVCFETDPRNKYVGMDLINYLRREGLWQNLSDSANGMPPRLSWRHPS